MKKISLLFSLFLFSIIAAQSFNKEKMDAFMDALETHGKFMGNVAVLKENSLVYSRSVGFADVENNKKNADETKFRIGSVSKTFTAVLVMKAVEEKKLNLSDRLSKFYPEIVHSDKITIDQLLNHRSGINNVTNRTDYLSWNQEYKTKDQMLQLIKEGGNDFKPGLSMNYSNSGYIILSYILEKIYQKPYSKILEEKITQPLGLKNTFYGSKINIENGEAFSYKLPENAKQAETDMSIPSGAGALVSTTADLLKFIASIFNNKIISSKSLHEMQKMTDNYGFGLFSVPFYENIGYGHNGGIDGFTSSLYYFPELKTGYAMLSNATAFDNNKIAIAALSAATGKQVDIPNFKLVNVEVSQLKKFTGSYSSNQVPLKIEIREKGGKLFAQATGQAEFPLDAISSNTFVFETAGIEVVFNADHKSMLLNQAGMKIPFKKDEK